MSHPTDGQPQYGGWPAIYSYFIERGLSKPEIDEMPLYLAFLTMGAISPDKVSLKLSDRDGAAFRAGLAEKKKGRAMQHAW